MSLSIREQWKQASTITTRSHVPPLRTSAASCATAGAATARSTNARQEDFCRKASAQVGTSVVASRLPLSGERCSSGSHEQNEGTKHHKERVPPIHVRFKTRNQVEHVKGKAASAKLSVNSFICSATLDYLYVPPVDPGILGELRMIKRQLTGIGINLNQLVHKVNAGTGHIDPVLEYIDVIRLPVLDGIGIIRKALSRRTDGPLP